MRAAKFSVPQPYVAVVDPAGGKKEEPAAGKRRTRSKRGESRGRGRRRRRSHARTACSPRRWARPPWQSAGNAPRWLALGIGTYLASQVEPRSPYYQSTPSNRLRQFQQGWQTKANEALGGADQITAESLHAVGFALVEAMMSEE